MENWAGEPQESDLEAPVRSVPRRLSVLTANWSSNTSGLELTKVQDCTGRGDGTNSSSSEASRTRTGASRQTSEERWTHYNVIVELATSLLDHGAPSHRIEVIVSAIGNALSIQTSFYNLPTFSVVQFPTLSSGGNVNGPSQFYLIKKRGSMNFHKLPQVYDIVKDLLRNGISCDEIKSRLENLRSAEERAKEFPEWAIALSYPFAAMTSAVMFFHGTWKDALMSGVLGLIPGLLRLVANRFESIWWTYEIIACFIVSVVGTALAQYFCYSTLILSAPVALLPSYTVTAAVIEIMTKNIISGAVRLCYTVVYLALMIFGMTCGSILYHAQSNTSGVGFDRKPNQDICMPEGNIYPNHLWLLLCIPLYIIAFNIYLRSPLRQWIPMLVVGSLGYVAGYACKHIWHTPPEISGFAAAFAIGLSANIYARVFDKFAFNTIVAGIFIQVPGSWGARGMLSLAYAEYDRGLYYCFQMLTICVGIAGALLLSKYLVFGFKQQIRGVPHMNF